MLGVINLGISNLCSVLNALNYLDLKHFLVNAEDDLKKADRLILPGVGTFGAGMQALRKLKIENLLKEKVINEKVPILGICLGAQLFFDQSEESPGVVGLKILEGKVVKLPSSKFYSIPRIGWAETKVVKNFFSFQKDENNDFYYLHSFFIQPADKSIVSLVTEDEAITAGFAEDNIFGFQFHPEKSYQAGLRILKDFATV